MTHKKQIAETELAALARHFREKAGITKAQAARELGVAKPTVFNAEEHPELSLTALRIRMIEKYSPYQVGGPIYLLKNK